MTYSPLRTPRPEELTVRGLRHRVTWWGDRKQTPIVLLHGFQDCGATWQFLVDCLPPEWSLAAPDWRGFGHSEWAPGGYWFPDYFADLETLLDQLVPGQPARVIGHSMGANIAQVYAGVRPQRLAWLANLEGFGLPRTASGDAPTRYARWLDELRQPLREGRYRSPAQLAGFLRSKNPRLTADRADFVAEAWTRPVSSSSSAGAGAGAGARGGDVELLFDPRHRLVNPILYRREEAEACWARVMAPVLLAQGDATDSRSETMRIAAEQMRARIRNLRVVTVAGAGHMLHHEEPQTLARHIVAFARTCDEAITAAPPPTV
jgi:pimeloyl-ACP methyl ester carboxylesterase